MSAIVSSLNHGESLARLFGAGIKWQFCGWFWVGVLVFAPCCQARVDVYTLYVNVPARRQGEGTRHGVWEALPEVRDFTGILSSERE